MAGGEDPAPSVPIRSGESSGSSCSILRKERFAASRSRLAVSRKSTGVPCLSMWLAEGSQPALDQRRVGQNPAVQRGVVHLQTAIEEQLLDVTVAERVTQIPRNGLQDQRCREVPTLEIVLRPALQLLG